MKFNIPNIRSMILGARLGYDRFLELYGIKKVIRDGPPTFEKGINRKLERYLKCQQQRLIAYRNDPMKFWALAKTLLRRSKSFRLLGLRNVRPNWFKDQEIKTVRNWLFEVDYICKNEIDSIEIIRTPIPKPDGGVRYINDPGVPNRIYLWMNNLMLHYWLETRLNDSQHGHRKGRGTLSAWREIAKFLNSKFIYEFDYAKFHDRIDRKVILLSLLKQGIPEEMSIKFTNLCSAYTTKVDEKDPLWNAFVTEGKYKHFYRGVVQGSNIAGLLGLCVLEYLNVYDLKKGRYVGYADDGLLFSDDPSVLDEWRTKLNPKAGVEEKSSKSGWVRFNGEWLKELKFVGLAYDGIKDIVRANTHSGKTEEMKWELVNLPYFIENKVAPYKTLNKLRTLDFWKGEPYLGLLMSEIWKSEGNKPQGSADLPVPRSLYFLLTERFFVTLATGSSYAYYMIQEMLKDIRWEKVKYPWTPTPSRVVADLGGFILLTKGSASIQTIKLKDGRDLVPTESKRPTPVIVTHNRIGSRPGLPQFWNHKW